MSGRHLSGITFTRRRRGASDRGCRGIMGGWAPFEDVNARYQRWSSPPLLRRWGGGGGGEVPMSDSGGCVVGVGGAHSRIASASGVVQFGVLFVSVAITKRIIIRSSTFPVRR